MDLLRHGAMPALFGGVRAPSTLGSFLRAFTWVNVLPAAAGAPAGPGETGPPPLLLPGGDVLAFLDIDSQPKRVYGYQKQGAAFGHTKIAGKSLLVRGLTVLAATICTPLAAPVIAAIRRRDTHRSVVATLPYSCPVSRVLVSAALVKVGTSGRVLDISWPRTWPRSSPNTAVVRFATFRLFPLLPQVLAAPSSASPPLHGTGSTRTPSPVPSNHRPPRSASSPPATDSTTFRPTRLHAPRPWRYSHRG